MCTYPDIATNYILSHVERFEAKRKKLSHVVVQRKRLCSDEVDEYRARRRVKSETKSLFVMSSLTLRGKQRKQGLALNIASNSSSEKLQRELHRVVSPGLQIPFEAYYCSTLSDGVCLSSRS